MNKVKVGLCACLVFITLTGTIAVGEGNLSPLAVVADKAGRIFVAEFGANQVAVFETGRGEVTGTISLPDRPSGLALSPDESYLYVSGGSAAGKVYLIDLKKKNVTGSISVGHTPSTVVVSPDASTQPATTTPPAAE